MDKQKDIFDIIGNALRSTFTNTKDEQREKKFWKLKQGDRIEYVLHLERISEYFQGSFYSFLNFIFLVNFGVLLLSILMYIGFESVALIGVLGGIVKVSIIFLGVVLVCDIAGYFLKRKAIFKLRERFDLNYIVH